MYTLAAIAVILTAAVGSWLIWYGWRDRRDPLRPSRPRRAPMTRRTKLTLTAGLLIGVLAWLITGWLLLVPAGVAAAYFLPRMLARRAADREIARLEAVEEWLRHLVGLLNAGIGLEQAVAATRKTLPRELEPEIRLLISRLTTNQPTRPALMEFADSLDDATGDLVCSALMIASELRANGLPKALKDFADSVAEDVKDRRAVEVDRRGPRTQARMVSAIFIGILAYMFLATDYMDPFRTPQMQVVLVALLGAFAGLLLYIGHLTRPIKPPRFLRDAPRTTTPWWKPQPSPTPEPTTNAGLVFTTMNGGPR